VSFEKLRERLRSCIDRSSDVASSVSVEQTLKARSRELAAKRLEPVTRERLGDVIVVRRAQVRLAASVEVCSEVRLVKLCHLPGSNRTVCGLFQIRGRVHAMIDVAHHFTTAEPLEHRQQCLVLLLRGNAGELGLRIDELLGPRSVYADELQEDLAEKSVEFVSQVTRDLVHIIDVEALMDSPEIRAGGRRR